jgi:hypothetical protein
MGRQQGRAGPLILLCGGRTRKRPRPADSSVGPPASPGPGAVKALIVTVDFLEAQVAELRAKVSTGYARGRLSRARERKDDTDV